MQVEPVTQRLDRLNAQWSEFAGGPAVLLYWLIDDEDGSLIDAFFEVQGHEQSPSTDLFVRLDAPFSNAAAHGAQLVAQLETHYAQLAPLLSEQGADASWRPPPPETDDDVTHLMAALASFWKHHQPVFERLALVLEPTAIGDPTQWEAWLGRAVAASQQPTVKLVTFDRRSAPMLAQLASSTSDKVQPVAADLNSAALPAEVLAAIDRPGTPQAEFRKRFVDMGSAMTDGDVASVTRLGQEACAIAEGEGWQHLVVATHFLEGGGALNRGDHPSAIRSYAEANAAAERAQEQGEPYALDLRVKCTLAMGTVSVAAQVHDKGATFYEQAAALATELGDPLMQLEGWRMASWCHEQLKRVDAAWGCGVKALAVGENMDEQARQVSTLPFVGEALIRLTKYRKYGHLRLGIEQQMTKYLGKNWRKRTSEPPAPVQAQASP